MSYFVLFIDLVILLEYFFSILNSQILGDWYVKACLFAINIAIAFDAKSARVVGCKDRWSFDKEFIGHMEAIMTYQRRLSCLHVSVIEGRCFLMEAFLDYLLTDLLLI